MTKNENKSNEKKMTPSGRSSKNVIDSAEGHCAANNNWLIMANAYY